MFRTPSVVLPEKIDEPFNRNSELSPFDNLAVETLITGWNFKEFHFPIDPPFHLFRPPTLLWPAYPLVELFQLSQRETILHASIHSTPPKNDLARNVS